MKRQSNKKLKIALLVDDGLDSTDGVQQYVLTLGRWLSSKGHEVHYLAGETKRRDITNLHSMSRNLKVRFNGNTLSIPIFVSKRRIMRLLNEHSFDVVHVQVPHHPFMAARIIKRVPASTVVIGTFHILPFGLLAKVGTRLLGLWLWRNVKRFDIFLAVSPAAKVFAQRSFRVNATVVPNMVAIDKFRPQKTSPDNPFVRLVFLGRLVQRKGCYELLQALVWLRQHQLTTRPFHVDIYGRGVDQNKLEGYVESHGLADVVTFHGFVDEADKARSLQAADIAVFPSTGAESFGIVLIEAMASGAGVVLGGDNAGYKSVLESLPETLIDPLNIPLFAQRLADLIDDDLLRTQLHQKQQELVKQYDVNVIGERILRIYDDCKRSRKA